MNYDGHFVQLYGTDDGDVIAGVAAYVAQGLHQGDKSIIIATPEHCAAFLAELGEAAAPAVADGSIELYDAAETLRRFMVHGYPDSDRFESSIGQLIRDAAAGSGKFRAYGEMVGLLWQSRQYPAAIRLEQLWNRLRQSVNFNLYCSYPIDVFAGDFQPGMIDALLSAHTHVLPAVDEPMLEAAIERAIGDVLGVAPSRDELTGAQRGLPAGQSMILWLRHAHPHRAQDVLTQAKSYYARTA